MIGGDNLGTGIDVVDAVAPEDGNAEVLLTVDAVARG